MFTHSNAASLLTGIRAPFGSRARRLWLLWLPLLAAGACTEITDEGLAYHRGLNAIAEGRHDWARIYFEQDFERHPERLDSLKREGLAWLSGYQRSLSSGVEALSAYLEHEPDDQESRWQLAQSLLLLGQWEEARRQAKLLDDSPAATALRAEILLEVDPDSAQEAIEAALLADPDSATAHDLAAQYFADQGEREQALAHAERAVDLDPFRFQTHYLLARLRRAAGDLEEARQALDVQEKIRRLQHDGTMAPLPPDEELALLRELEPRVNAESLTFLRRKTSLLFQTGDLAGASAALRRFLEDSRSTLGDRLEFAKSCGDRGALALARGLYEGILAEQPDNRGARSSMAQLELQDGNAAAARERLRLGLETHPHFARYHYLLGRVAEVEDQLEAAVGHYTQAVELAPWELGWRLALGELLAFQGESQKLHELLDDAPEESPQLEAFRQRHSA